MYVATTTVVFRKYAPPFCNLSLSTKRRGGLYTGCDNFNPVCSYMYTQIYSGLCKLFIRSHLIL